MKYFIPALVGSQILFYLAVSFVTYDLSWPVTRAPEWTSLQRSDFVLGLVMYTTIFVGLVVYTCDPNSKYKKFY